MKRKVLFVVMALLVLSLSTAYAGNELRIGSAGAQELRIPYGSRGTAMGGQLLPAPMVLSQCTGTPPGWHPLRALRQCSAICRTLRTLTRILSV